MSGGNRLYRATLGACLATLLFGTPALAQQDVEKPTPTVNEGQGVTGETPAPEEDSGENTEREQAPPADPLPAPPPVDNEADTEPACGPRCEATEQREKDDLGAQQDMARFANDLVDLTLWQIIVGAVGVGLLIITLKLARDANKAAIRAAKAAEDAVEITSDTAKHQLRAYVLPEKVSFLTNEAGNLAIAVKLLNTGQTPARKVRHITRCGVGTPNTRDFNYDIPAGRIFGDIGPNLPTSGNFYQTDGNDFIDYGTDIFAGEKVFYVWGRLKYFDIFDREQTTDYRFRWSPEHDEFVDCDEGNKAT